MSPGVRDPVAAERTMTMAKIAGLSTDGSKVETGEIARQSVWESTRIAPSSPRSMSCSRLIEESSH